MGRNCDSPAEDPVRLAPMRSSFGLRLSRRAAAVTAIAAGALVAAGCGSVGHLGGGGNISNGKELFTQTCGSCHILEDAGTTGTIGPNIDAAFFQYRKDMEGADASATDTKHVEETIRQVVRGQIAYPTVDPSTSAPGMPADILTGQDADDVATYVARVAGTGTTADTTG
jgi:mono/diheme cytochrome c family protein